MDKNGDMHKCWNLIKQLEYTEVWSHAYGDKIGGLAQGMKWRVVETNTMHFIHKHEDPLDHFKDVMYGKINCNYQEGEA